MTTERDAKAEIRLALGRRGDLRLFNNPVGEAWQGRSSMAGRTLTLEHARRIAFGLAPGSCDLIGWRTVTVTPDMVGQTVAIFTGVETKSARGRAVEDQRNFIAVLRRAGGIAGLARTPEQAKTLLDRGLATITEGRSCYEPEHG
jgi:hypothetical protein